jgi:hypothetical protein
MDVDDRRESSERHRLGDAFDCVLGADIDRGPRRTLVPVGRGDVDNATAALSLHDAHFVLHAQDHAENSSTASVDCWVVSVVGVFGTRSGLN